MEYKISTIIITIIKLCFKCKWLVKFVFHIPKISVQKQNYLLPSWIAECCILGSVQNNQANRVYLIFRCLYGYCLQRMATVSLEKKVLRSYFLSKFIFLMKSLHSQFNSCGFSCCNGSFAAFLLYIFFLGSFINLNFILLISGKKWKCVIYSMLTTSHWIISLDNRVSRQVSYIWSVSF